MYVNRAQTTQTAQPSLDRTWPLGHIVCTRTKRAAHDWVRPTHLTRITLGVFVILSYLQNTITHKTLALLSLSLSLTNRRQPNIILIEVHRVRTILLFGSTLVPSLFG
ncbi:hypothetical protein HanIR_Chr03g0121731 [Helianthus annuus]|nr:hypothetical protein HanIR_Chr03g0121731 [Helianthus annuus]